MKKSLLYLGLSPLVLFAGDTVFVKQTINIYETPSLSAKVVGNYKKRAPIGILERISNEDGVWQKTEDGYVLGKYLSFRQLNITQYDPVLENQQQASTVSWYAKESSNIRNKPTVKSEVIGIYKKNEPINYLQKLHTKNAGTWIQSDRGFVSSELVSQKISIVKNLEPQIIDEDTQASVELPSVKEVAKKEEQKEEQTTLEQIPLKIYGNFEYAQYLQEEGKERPKVVETPEKTLASQNDILKNIYLQIGTTLNSFDGSKKDITGSILIDNPKTEGMGYKISVGKYIFDRYALGFHYDNVDLNQINIYSYSFSLDYRFDTEYQPYLGFTLGKIYKKWNIDPLVNSTIKDNDISSNLYGIQGGALYPLKNNWFLDGKISYQKFNLKTNLISTPAKSIIEYKDRKGLEVGVRYQF